MYILNYDINFKHFEFFDPVSKHKNCNHTKHKLYVLTPKIYLDIYVGLSASGKRFLRCRPFALKLFCVSETPIYFNPPKFVDALHCINMKHLADGTCGVVHKIKPNWKV